MSDREKINVVWFKRDLRLQDNEAIFNAIKKEKPTLLLYVFENTLLDDPHYDERHWNFIKESLNDLNERLQPYNTKILTVTSEIITVFNQLMNFYEIDTVFSHQETGLLITYNRDKEFTRYCRNNSITWKENNNNGVLRGLLNRKDWFEKWESYMNLPSLVNKLDKANFLDLEEIEKLERYFMVTNLSVERNINFQKGGVTTAWKYAESFFEERYKKYSYNISKPEHSRKSCSRLSPYIAWGNVSIRQIYKKAKEYKTDANKKQLNAFISRLRWQAHFIQKFEMEHTMEEASINKGYHKLKKSISLEYQKAWKEGKIGFPLVDASMKCLKDTGYVNFRMRAMLVSFFTHILWQPWQACSEHLSQLFLDFEPGIHFPQLNMQAGETGVNELRVYNPITNSLKHDEDAVFIKKWLPELAHLPKAFIHEPYLMTDLDQQFNNFELGIDYPKPIVDIKTNRKKALDILWGMKNDEDVVEESKRILSRHTLSNRSRMMASD